MPQPDTRPPVIIQPLETERLLLTPLDPDADAEDLHLMYADPEVAIFAEEPAFSTVEQTRNRLRWEVDANHHTSWAIRLRSDPAALGTIGIFSDQGTTIRGIGWSLRSSHWGLGITSEAAKAVVPFLLAQPGVDALEAWVDVQNTRSLAVARNAGMTERGRLPRTYRDRIGQTVVMVGTAKPPEPLVEKVQTVIPVRDARATIELFTDILGLHIVWSTGYPVPRALLAISPYSGGPDLSVSQVTGEIAPVEICFHIAGLVDDVATRFQERGLELVAPPTNQPWYRRDCAIRLPDGHRIQLVGAIPPEPEENK